MTVLSPAPSAPPARSRPTVSLVPGIPRVHRHWSEEIATVCAVLLPIATLIIAIVLLWGVAFSWVYLAIMVGMYLITAVGVTVGYHRLFTHRSFETPAPIVATLGVLGSMAAEGSIIDWVAYHRRHHQHSDGHEDPHSPHNHGGGVKGVLKGFFHAHMGWFFQDHPVGMERYAGDLRKNKLVVFLSKTFGLWVLLGMLIPAAAGGLITWSWEGVLLGFLWGGGVRLLLVHHVTWSINSVCHMWGSKPYRSDDESRNNAIMGVLALGEGWHNNHHAFPTSAKHGLAWWQIDVSYYIIRVMGWVGLAKKIRVPTIEARREKMRVGGEDAAG